MENRWFVHTLLKDIRLIRLKVLQNSWIDEAAQLRLRALEAELKVRQLEDSIFWLSPDGDDNSEID